MYTGMSIRIRMSVVVVVVVEGHGRFAGSKGGLGVLLVFGLLVQSLLTN